MTTNQTVDTKNQLTEWPPVPRPTTNGALGLAEFAAKIGNPKPQDHFTRCACGNAIHPDYTQCEACEYAECPACGNKNHGFCQRCVENGNKITAIKGSERWAAGLQS